MNLILIILYACVLTPLFRLDFLYRPETTGTNFYFRITVELLLGVFFCWSIKWGKVNLSLSPVLAAAAAAVFITFLSTFQSEDWKLSFLGDFERMEGAVTWLHLFVLLAVLSASVIHRIQWRRLFTVTAVVSGIICLLNLCGFLADGGVGRAAAIITNPAFLANYLAVHFFLCLILIFKGGRWCKMVFSVASLLHLTVIVLTGTRSVFIALVISFAFISALTFSGFMNTGAGWLRKFGRKGLLLSVLCLAAILSLTVVLFAFLATRNAEESGAIPDGIDTPVARLLDYRPSDRTISLRLTLWKIALRGASEHFWTGIGPEQFEKVYYQYFEPSLADKDPWYDRPHNTYLYCLLSTGVFGLVTFLAVFAAAFLCCMKLSDPRERFILSALVVYFFCQGFFVFNHITALIPFVLVLAYIANHSCGTVWRIDLKRICFSTSLRWGMVIGLTGLILFSCNASMLMTCLKIKEMGDTRERPSLSHLRKCRDALHCPPPWQRAAIENCIWFYVQHSVNLRDTPLNFGYLDAIVEHIGKDTAEHPGDARHQLFYASFFRKINDPQKAMCHLENALASCHNHPEIIMELGRSFFLLKDYSSAENCFRKANRLCPAYIQAAKALNSLKENQGRASSGK